jgi:hypothetical protein
MIEVAQHEIALWKKKNQQIRPPIDAGVANCCNRGRGNLANPYQRTALADCSCSDLVAGLHDERIF